MEGQHSEADIARVLHPLPRRPLRVRCWKPDDGMASDLQLFFDNDDRRRARR